MSEPKRSRTSRRESPAGRSVRLALVQQRAGEDLADNQARGLHAVDRAAAAGASIVCFPELAFTPFYPQHPASGSVLDLAEPVPGPITGQFAERAKRHNLSIVLNLFERDGEHTFDTSPVLGCRGEVLGRARMVHITDFEHFHERGYYLASEESPQIFHTAGLNLGVVICYDRHYPEMFRALAARGAELVLVPQAGALDEWPPGVFEAEIQAAALHNGMFVALCNRVGREQNLEFGGESFVCAPNGEVIARAGRGAEDLLICDLDLDSIAVSPAKRLFWPDRRPDLYRRWQQEIDD